MHFVVIVAVFVIVASCREPTGLEVPVFDDMAGHPVAFPTTTLSTWVTRISPPGRPPYDIVTVVPPEISFKRGLAAAAIVGRLKRLSNIEGQGGIGPQDLIPNPTFLVVLHRIIAEHAPEIREYQAEAKEERTGWLYVIDGRTAAPDRVVHRQDILGAFAVRDGTIQAHSYKPNDRYLVFTEDGFLRLHEVLGRKLGDELLAANSSR